MRIGIITNIASPYQVDFLEELQKRVEKLSVFFLSESEDNRDWPLLQDASFNFEYVVPKFNTPAGYFNPMLHRLMRKTPSDAWVLAGSYTYPSNLVARREAMKDNVPWLFWGERPGTIPLEPLKRRYLTWFLRSASAVWGVSKQACDTYADVSPDGVICSRIPYVVPTPREPEAEALTGQGQDKELRLALTGQLISRKNPDTAIEAVALLAREGMRVRLDVIGDGPLSGDLRELAASLGVNVIFHGSKPRNEVFEHLRSADAMLFPTREDGWGVVVMEALSVGTPVIGSRSGDALLEANEIDPAVAVCTEATPGAMAAIVSQLYGEGFFSKGDHYAGRAREVATRFSAPVVAERAARSLREVASR